VDLVQVAMRGGSPGIDDGHLDATPAIMLGYLIEAHGPCPPAHDVLLRQAAQRWPFGQRAQHDDVGLLQAQVGIALVEAPVIGAWFHIQPADRVRIVAIQTQARHAVGAGDGGAGQYAAEQRDLDLG
jgi:hypothetical protein